MTQPSTPNRGSGDDFPSQEAEPVAHLADRRSAPAARASDDPWLAFEPLYDQHHERLFRVAVLLCYGNIADAEDAVAETFVSVHRAWLDGKVETFFAYARQTLVNHVMARYRKRKTAERYLPTQLQTDNGGFYIDQHVVDSAVLLEALARLSPRRRTAVVLRFYEDLPYVEIAQAMNVSLGTAKAQVSVGLSHLRQILEPASRSGATRS